MDTAQDTIKPSEIKMDVASKAEEEKEIPQEEEKKVEGLEAGVGEDVLPEPHRREL